MLLRRLWLSAPRLASAAAVGGARSVRALAGPSRPTLISAAVRPPPLQPLSPCAMPCGRSLLLDAVLPRQRTRGLSSSLAGIQQAGLPRMERDARGRAVGPAKGGKARKNQGGVLAIKNTWNNTLISISNSSYKQVGFVSAGTVGFKKSKRSTQFATERAISEAFAKARSFGIRRAMITMRGPAIALRKPLFKQLRDEVGIRIVKLRMTDNVPHGGCRPRKSRRRRWKTRARRR